MNTDQTPGTNPNLARPVRIYLDLSDWSYLEEGREPEIENFLRKYASENQALFLVSEEHLIDVVTAREDSHRKRLTYMWNFPNTCFIKTTALDVLRQSAMWLLQSDSKEISASSWTISVTPIQEISVSEFIKRGLSKKAEADMRALSSFAGTISRMATKGFSKKDLVEQNRRIAEILQGVGNAVFLSSETFDPVFERCVKTYLILDNNHETEQVSRAFKIYRDKKRFARIALPLACKCAVYEKIYYDAGYETQPSDETDKEHTAFVVFADVFTCDKRNFDPIRQVVKAAKVDVAIIRSNRLEQVVKTIEERIACS